MEIYKVELKATNSIKNIAYSEKTKEYINLENGFVLVKKEDLVYIFENFQVLSVEYIGILFQKEITLKI